MAQSKTKTCGTWKTDYHILNNVSCNGPFPFLPTCRSRKSIVASRNCFSWGQCCGQISHDLSQVVAGSTLTQLSSLPRYVISSPKILRAGASEKVVVQAFGYEQEFGVTISVKSFPDKQTIYASGQTQLTPGNKFQGSVTLTLQPSDLSRQDPDNLVQYVFLEAVSPHFTKEKKMPVTYENGFLFIQTDKPIYTPDQTVKVRVYSLNEELRPAKRAVTLTFEDPDDVEVDMIKENDMTGIISFPDFKIPPHPKFGAWTIKAKYEKDFTTTAQTKFQVKEYAMPSFSVTIEPENNFISYQHFERFKIAIKARYFYNEAVAEAQVYVRFGIIQGSRKTMMPKALKFIEMEEGIAEFYFNSKQAVSELSYQSLQDLDGAKLYIAVSVLETKGGRSEDKELTRVLYALSPYKLHLVATPLFVKPGLPYFIKAQVKDPIGVPVRNLPVRFSASAFNEEMEEISLTQESEKNVITANDGTALEVFNIPSNTKVLEFRITTADPQLSDESQARESYEARSYISRSGSYLYVDWASNHKVLHVGSTVHINIYPASHYIDKIHHYSYLILSKGKILTYGTQEKIEGSNYQSLQFQLTKDMVPSARLLVYYIVTGEGAAELVADSAWLNVEQKCGSSLEVTLQRGDGSYPPGSVISLSMRSEFESLVALSSMDQAVYGVLETTKKPMEKALLQLETSDLGCNAGGGLNNVDVFRMAGLTFMTNANAEDNKETDEACKAVLRSTRSIIDSQIEALVSKFQHPEIQRCCRSGAEKYPVPQTCSQRISRVRGGPRCLQAFKNCCEFAEKLRKNETHKVLILARNAFAALLDLEPQVRSYFPESWLWEVHPVSSSKTLSVTLPDSLTTWEIQGVSISDQGICVADALQVQVTKEVFMEVHMPYSVVRGEQIKLLGTVYNYHTSRITFCTSVTVDSGICLFGAAGSNPRGQQQASCSPVKELHGSSITRVQFTILPLELGVHTVNFTLKSSAGSEILVKQLRVVPEGIRKVTYEGYTLDPQGVYGSVKRQVEFPLRMPLNMVPKTKLERTMTVKGLLLGDVIKAAVDPEGLKRFTDLPRGSAETELVSIVPLFFVYDYLEKTDSWHILGQGSIIPSVNMKRKMKEGIISVLSYRKPDFSFSMWRNGESSTWLTAFVLRIFGQVHRYVPVNQNALCNTMTWMIDICQMDDGSFREISSYVPVKLQGTLPKEQKEKTLYLTAFSLIGFAKSIHICPLMKVEEAKDKAVDYLLKNVHSAQSTFTLAIATYALALTRIHHLTARSAYNSLKKEALVKAGPPMYRFWKESSGQVDPSSPSEDTARMVETTAYALLTTLLRGDQAYANPIIRWLSEQQRYGGGFYSTQDTINALESLTEYSILLKRLVLDMNIKAAYKKHGDFHHYRLTRKNYISKPVEAPLEDDIEVRTGSNTGLAIVKLRNVYYKSSTSEDTCNFELKIDVKSETDDGRGVYFRTNEVRHLVACAKYKPLQFEPHSASSHAVMDISLATGLEANTEDLSTLLNNDDRLIADYEIADGHVLVQLDSIPAREFLCIGFQLTELFQVRMPSPATFTVYEYHTPEKKCSVFYNPYGEESLVRLCEGAECKCMEAECGRMQTRQDESLSVEARKEAACQESIAYVYKVNVLASKAEGSFVKYTAILLDLFKRGAAFAKQNDEITFIKKYSCTDIQLNPRENYLIMGKEALKIGEGANARYQYPLDAMTWIEWWPSEGVPCDSCQAFSASLEEFADDLFLNGC